MVRLTALLIVTVAALRAAVTATSTARVRSRLATTTSSARVLPDAVERVVDRALAARRSRQLERALPFALDDVARSLRSGGSLRMAIVEAASRARGVLGGDLARVAAELDDGHPLHDALAAWEARRPVRSVRLTVAALSLAAETGGASARAIDGVAATLRTNLGITDEIRALSSQARLSALVIVLAPLGFSALAASSDASTALFLFRTPLGLLCLVVGLGLYALGWLWMRRIVAVVA
jgi:tight adherence protein B